MVFQRWFLVFVLTLAISSGEFSPLLPSAFAQSSSSSTKTSSTTKKTTKKKTASASGKKKKASSPRMRRMRQAFVASETLKPMARQLLQDRTPAAYAGVLAFAQRHSKEDAGALAWLVLGYAHYLDRDFAKSIDPFNRAKPHAGDLGDYVQFYLASSYSQSGRTAEALSALNNFQQSYPESLLIRDAAVLEAQVLLADNRPQEVIPLLEKNRQPARADVELALGRSYAAAGQPDKALTILRNLFFTMPLSAEAAQADLELRKLPAAQQAPIAMDSRLTRADLLLKGKRFSDAADEYRGLVDQVPPTQRPEIQLALATCLRRSGHAKEAKQLLESMTATTAEQNAERLFNLGEIARGSNDDDAFLHIVDQIRQASPTSPFLEQSLLSAGNIYLLRRDYDKAIDSFRELQQRFPNGGRASYAHWKAAWLSLRQGRNTEAKADFEQQIALYPASGEVPAALYWRARLAEEDNDPAMAKAYYLKLTGRFQNYYYGALARQRLTKLTQATAGTYAILDRVSSIDTASKTPVAQPPADDLRVQKAQLLENGALLDFAIRELQSVDDANKSAWLPAETARMYRDIGRYDRAIETLKRAVPNYFAVDLPSLPRAYWEALFPKPYWVELKKFSENNALDPYLVASLIRQESEFNPNALSNKNAVGLMQLLPKVGKGVAKQEKLKHFNASQLFMPAINLQLGTRYFRSMVDKFGAFEYALAAYNAGSDRVEDWMGQGKYRDTEEFVESIPFTETREYVQAIMRNAVVYRKLYGAP